MTTKTITKLEALWTAYNLARTTYYRDQSEANEQAMDDALRAYLTEKGGR